MDIKSKVQHVDPIAKARNVEAIAAKTGNIYESLAIVSNRAKQLNMELKEELSRKLREFEETYETIEEVQENKEQIEISKFYERIPNPAVIALDEFMSDKLSYKYAEDDSKKA